MENELCYDEEFVLPIERTGLIKSINISMKLEWTTTNDDDNVIKWGDTELETFDPKKDNSPKVVLQDGIVEWMVANLKMDVYARAMQLSDKDGKGPELIFGCENDRASFIMRWL